ncbi:hypothetical protein MIR68_008873 [Amoeboaphelidium protococcarum]|nr:hypothetical protein MIR68_008873 [Amoeboaphelidium protococcarum]
MSLLEYSLAKGVNLPQEIEEGNVEYKMMLNNDVREDRFHSLCTQMKWRMSEGHGVAYYELGVQDNGRLVGLSHDEMEHSLERLRVMAKEVGAEVADINRKQVPVEFRRMALDQRFDYFEYKSRQSKSTPSTGKKVSNSQLMVDKNGDEFSVNSEFGAFQSSKGDNNNDDTKFYVAEVTIKSIRNEQNFQEIRIAFLGNTNCGKSTLLGYLSHGELDNGSGKARLNLLRHRHEIESGRSSSISHSIIGFSDHGELLNYGATMGNVGAFQDGDPLNDADRNKGLGDWCEGQIVDLASKIVMMLDTCGHPKYLQTTIQGLTSYNPDYACVLVDGSSGFIDSTTKELLGLSLVLNVPIFIVVSKMDMVVDSAVLKSTIQSLIELLMLPGTRRLPKIVKNMEDVAQCAKVFAANQSVPIFLTSSVTGDNMELLERFLYLLPSKDHQQILHTTEALSDEYQSLLDADIEFVIEDIFNVPNVGIVVGGRMESGQIINQLHTISVDTNADDKNAADTITNAQNQLYVGPIDEQGGKFIPVGITSIHRQRRPVKAIRAGQVATLALASLGQNTALRRGMVITSNSQLKSSLYFEADVCVLYAATGCTANVNCSPDGLQAVLDEFSRKRKSSSSTGHGGGDDQHNGRKSPERLRKPRWGHIYIGTIHQPAVIVDVVPLEKDVTPTNADIDASDVPVIVKQVNLLTGKRYNIKFRFVRWPEYVKVGSRLLYREVKSEQQGKRSPGIKMVGDVVSLND